MMIQGRWGISGEGGTSSWGDVPNIGMKIDPITASVIQKHHGYGDTLTVIPNGNRELVGIAFFIDRTGNRLTHGVYVEEHARGTFNGDIKSVVKRMKPILESYGWNVRGINMREDIDNYLRKKKSTKPKTKRKCRCNK